MSKLNRRKLFALGGAGLAVAGATGAKGAEIRAGAPGITVQLSRQPEGWAVAVPDWDGLPNYASAVQGHVMPIKWLLLNDFLVQIEAEDTE